jgi:hypothetical protein
VLFSASQYWICKRGFQQNGAGLIQLQSGPAAAIVHASAARPRDAGHCAARDRHKPILEKTSRLVTPRGDGRMVGAPIKTGLGRLPIFLD